MLEVETRIRKGRGGLLIPPVEATDPLNPVVSQAQLKVIKFFHDFWRLNDRVKGNGFTEGPYEADFGLNGTPKGRIPLVFHGEAGVRQPRFEHHYIMTIPERLGPMRIILGCTIEDVVGDEANDGAKLTIIHHGVPIPDPEPHHSHFAGNPELAEHVANQTYDRAISLAIQSAVEAIAY